MVRNCTANNDNVIGLQCEALALQSVEKTADPEARVLLQTESLKGVEFGGLRGWPVLFR